MRIISPSIEILDEINEQQILKKLESIGRVCYKSENNITEDSAERFVKNIMNRNHESVLEHVSISVRVICDRGVSHEIVRNRIASYSQESTRYCNYSNDKFDNELTFIKPCWFKSSIEDLNTYANIRGTFDKIENAGEWVWVDTLRSAEISYFKLLENGATPQEARSILPNSIKTEIVMTMNLREWRHFFKLRCDKAAHPQTREIANMILEEFKNSIPVVFDDLYESFVGGINEKAE